MERKVLVVCSSSTVGCMDGCLCCMLHSVHRERRWSINGFTFILYIVDAVLLARSVVKCSSAAHCV